MFEPDKITRNGGPSNGSAQKDTPLRESSKPLMLQGKMWVIARGDVWVRFGHLLRQITGNGRCDRRHHPNGDVSRDDAGQRANFRARPLELAQRALDPRQQGRACLGQLHSPPMAGEERNSDLMFEQADVAGESGLREAQAI